MSAQSSPKIVEPSQNNVGGGEDRCGYCGKPKRPERAPAGSGPEVCRCPSASESTDPSIRLGAVPSSAFRRSPSPRPSLVPASSEGPPLVVSSEGSLRSKYEIVSVREKHGFFRKAVPRMPMPLAVFLCLLNVVLPGLGTLISTFTIPCGCETEHTSKRKSMLYNLLAGLLQFLSAPIVVGWIWSVLWGITFVNVSASKGIEDPSTGNML